MAGPPDQNFYEVEMIEDLLIELLSKIEKAKAEGDSSLARYYAILYTELEKIYAFYMLYLFPNEEAAND
jgi:hypothetical protein